MMDSLNKAVIAVWLTIVPCAVLLTLTGCGSELPPVQADAVSKLQAAGVKVTIQEGKVVSIDFWGVPNAANAVLHVKAFPDVEKLNFSGANIGDDELAHLAGLSELKHLGLTQTQVTDKGLRHLAGLAKLAILTLNNCNVSDEGLVHLQDLKELTQLHLNDTKISDEGLKHLTGLEKLEALLVFDTAVTSSGAAAFREKRPETMVVTSEGESGADDEANGQ